MDYNDFLEMTPEEIMQDWLDFILARDPLLQDTSVATFNSILAEIMAVQFWVYIQLLKQKVADSTVTTASGDALSALVLDRLPQGRLPGTKAIGSVIFSRQDAAAMDYVIPVNTVVSMTTDGNEVVQFSTMAEVTLSAGQTSVATGVECTADGVVGNVPAHTITNIVSPLYGIKFVDNDLGLDGGTEQEPDPALKRRYIYTIWELGAATIPMIREHLKTVAKIRQCQIDTIGQGDVLVVIDAEESVDPDAIDTMLFNNLAGGCTSPGLLAASLRNGDNIFEMNDNIGADVWVRNLQYIVTETTVGFTYKNESGIRQLGSVIFPAGSRSGTQLKATLASSDDQATLILATSYVGFLSFDIYLAKGTYPNCWVAPELQGSDVNCVITMTSTPEVGLLTNIQASLAAKLATYGIGEKLQHSDVYRYVFTDFATGRAFVGIDDVPTFTITCKTVTVHFGETLTMDADERVKCGTIAVTSA